MNVREQIEQTEKMLLCDRAALAAETRGRTQEIEKCPMRTDFQRDRDRIIHSNAFRRLKAKTQVFLSPEKDHYRTRLTHTLEVSQIARTIARAMRLNEDLTEAIALGHDLGHTPFGHAGERALDEVCSFRFRHYRQSVRVAERIEKLNLTWEVKNGFVCHTEGVLPATWEGQVVRIADRIAFLNHDLDDAIRAGMLSAEDIPWHVRYVLGRTKSQRFSKLIASVLENSREKIALGAAEQEAFDEFNTFMYENIYIGSAAKDQENKAIDAVKFLFEYFLKHPEKMPAQYCEIAEEDGTERAVVDYISGMSDTYAVDVFRDLTIPRGWNR